MILSGATTPGQNGPGGNGNEGAFHFHQSSRAGASPSDGLKSYPGLTFQDRILPLCKNDVDVPYSPNRLDR